MDMFNKAGELNASSVKDALQLISKFSSLMQDNLPSNFSFSGQPDVSEEKRDELISRALLTNDGKTALAQAMANPIRRNLDYQGIIRRAFVVDPLPQGALPVYDRDIDVTAIVVSSNGAAVESRVFGDRITVPEFEIVSNPTVRIAEVRRRRFNVIDRAVQKARQEVMAQEDSAGFAAINAGAGVTNTPQDVTDTGMLRRDLVRVKAQVEKWDLVVSKFFMNINEYNDILNWAAGGGTGLGDIDPVTQREILQTGIKAKIWGADILVSKIVPAGTIYACADPEFVGVMPIRQDIEVMPADEPRQLKLGWVVSENIGLAVVNTRGVARGSKGLVIGA
jgi:hypothetical protein